MEVSDRGEKARSGTALSVDDCRCPVCLEVFMEPVTLPCTHTFCKNCFLETVDKTTLCCPMCRKRVSTWARKNSRNNTLVNQQLWTQIQNLFPEHCQRRLSGQDGSSEDDLGVSAFFRRVSEPGELRQEYEEEVTRLTEEKRALDEEERRASEEFIQRLLAEEEQLQQEEMRRSEDDEKLARLLSNQLNSQETHRPADVTPAKKKKEVISGQIDRFLSPRPSKSSSSDGSLRSNKENVLVSQKDQRLLSHPDLNTLRPENPDPRLTHPTASLEEQLHQSTCGGPSSSKRRSSEAEEEEVTLPKRACLQRSSLPSVISGMSDCEMELLRRRQQQEEEDRRLALVLQKELDEEERKRAIDRRKGSTDAYPLRQSLQAKEEDSSSSTTVRKLPTLISAPKTPTNSYSGPKNCTTPTSAPKTSAISSSGPSSSRGSKQTTLTEMFSSISS